MEKELIKKQLDELKQTKEEYKDILTKREKSEIARREAVFGYYEYLTGKKMTEEQYEKYIKLFEKAGLGYNIKNFIEKEDGTQ